MSNAFRLTTLLVIVCGIVFLPRMISRSEANTATTPHPSNNLGKIQWEVVPSEGMQDLTTTYRARVPGGWMVTTIFKRNLSSAGMSFVPDVGHSWRINGIYNPVPTNSFDPRLPPQTNRISPKKFPPKDYKKVDSKKEYKKDTKKVEYKTAPPKSFPK